MNPNFHGADLTASIDRGMKYLYRIYPKHYDSKHIFVPLKMMEILMSALLKHPQMFKKQDVVDYTEFDYYTKVWQPLFEVMFEGSSIRIKSSESTFPYSTCRKREQYTAAKNLIAFNIDIRFFIDYKREEYDVCSGEMVKVDDHDKMVLDKAKLNRESKDDLDCLLDLYGDDAWTECTAWQIQTVGTTASINSIHLASNGTSVVIGRYDVELPSGISDLDSFLDTLWQLLTWRKYMMHEAADRLMKALDQKPAIYRPAFNLANSQHSVLQRWLLCSIKGPQILIVLF